MRTVNPGDAIRAEDRNEMIRALRAATPQEGPRPLASSASPHPWKCSVETAATPGQWRVRLQAGFVDDKEASVAYLAENDPRGWKMPYTFAAARLHAGVCERSWREKNDPPFLLVELSRDFSKVVDAARHPFFMTADAWEKDLYLASVFLCARPLNLIAGRVLPPRHRTWAGKMPSALTAYPYGIRELARLYVLSGSDPTDAEIFVQQREFYDLHSAPVEPVSLLPDYKPITTSFGGIGLGFADAALDAYNTMGAALTDQVNEALKNMQAATSTVEMWSV